jgi:hypothetical protein
MKATSTDPEELEEQLARLVAEREKQMKASEEAQAAKIAAWEAQMADRKAREEGEAEEAEKEAVKWMKIFDLLHEQGYDPITITDRIRAFQDTKWGPDTILAAIQTALRNGDRLMPSPLKKEPNRPEAYGTWA